MSKVLKNILKLYKQANVAKKAEDKKELPKFTVTVRRNSDDEVAEIYEYKTEKEAEESYKDILSDIEKDKGFYVSINKLTGNNEYEEIKNSYLKKEENCKKAWTEKEKQQVGAIEENNDKYKIYQNMGGEIIVTNHKLNDKYVLMDSANNIEDIEDKIATDWEDHASAVLWDIALKNDVWFMGEAEVGENGIVDMSANYAEETKTSVKKDYTAQLNQVKDIMKEYGYGLTDNGYIYLLKKEEPKDEGFQVKFKGDRLRVELDGKLRYSGFGPQAIEEFLQKAFYAKKVSSKTETMTKKAEFLGDFKANVLVISPKQLEQIRDTAKDMGDEIWAKINGKIEKIIAYGYEKDKLKIVYREPYYGEEEIQEMYDNADEVEYIDFETLELQKQSSKTNKLYKKAGLKIMTPKDLTDEITDEFLKGDIKRDVGNVKGEDFYFVKGVKEKKDDQFSYEWEEGMFGEWRSNVKGEKWYSLTDMMNWDYIYLIKEDKLYKMPNKEDLIDFGVVSTKTSATNKKAVLQVSENGMGYVLPNGQVVYPGDEALLKSELKGNNELLEKTKAEIARLEKAIEESKEKYPDLDISRYPDSIVFKLSKAERGKEYLELFNETIDDILNAFKENKLPRQATKKQATKFLVRFTINGETYNQESISANFIDATKDALNKIKKSKGKKDILPKEISSWTINDFDDIKVNEIDAYGVLIMPNYTKEDIKEELYKTKATKKQAGKKEIETLEREAQKLGYGIKEVDKDDKYIYLALIDKDKIVKDENVVKFVYNWLRKHNLDNGIVCGNDIIGGWFFGVKNEDIEKSATIKHENGVYNVYSESGKCLGKGYKTKEEAEKRLKQVEYFKHKDKTAATGYDFYGPKYMPDEDEGTFRIKYYGGPGHIEYLRKARNGKYHWKDQNDFDFIEDYPFETTDYELAKKLVDQFGGEIEKKESKQVNNKKKSLKSIVISKMAEKKTTDDIIDLLEKKYEDTLFSAWDNGKGDLKDAINEILVSEKIEINDKQIDEIEDYFSVYFM